MTPVSLREISTCLDAPIITSQFILDNDPHIDSLEYGMGMCRGGISEYRESSTLMVDVHNDMEPSLRRRRWALLPTFEAFRTIIELFVFNYNHLPSERRHFTEDLPEQEYDYKLLPVIDDDEMVAPLYLTGALVQNPRRNLLHIRSCVHPCFVIPTLLRYLATGRSNKLSPNPQTEAIDALIGAFNSVTHLPVYLSWLGPRETWTGFNRSFILAKIDPHSDRAARFSMPPLPTSPTWTRKGKGATRRKPSSERSRSLAKKSVHSSGLRTTKGKEKGRENMTSVADERTPQPGMSTRSTVRSR